MPDRTTADGLAAVLEKVAAADAQIASFGERLRVAVLRNITVEGIDSFLQYHLLPQRIAVDVVFGGYGSMMQDVLDARGPVAGHDPEIVVLALALEDMDAGFGGSDWTCDAVRTELGALFDRLAERTRATIVVHSFIEPEWSELGLTLDADRRDLTTQVRALNDFIADTVRRRAPRFVFLDFNRYVRRLGSAQALDARAFYLWRAPFRRPFVDAWSQQLSRVACALRGRTKKVLVLDCDNTLWGGVVGEDGVQGIALDAHQYPGRAFHDFHRAVVQLAERGVVVALCSKNNEADVLQVLDEHPACLLRRRHLAAWRIDWNDKAGNIASLAEELNVGLDAFVFVDDNPAECELVRQMLPAVTVLQVSKKAHELPSLLWRDGLFDTLSLTDEDQARGAMYQSESQRKSAREGSTDLDDYLRSLQTRAVVHRVRPAEVPRVAQLTQKTNQFNLTTRRYSEPEISALAIGEDSAVYTMTVSDRFGGLGLVGVLILRREAGIGGRDGRGVIDSFLLSCRALGRKIEDAMVELCLAEQSRQWDVTEWLADYLPTAKNAQVADYWLRSGFAPLVEAGSGAGADARRFRRDAAARRPLPAHIALTED